ncbi:hypothetical protein N302_16120, partial [Corvus brachyrhynchos]
IEEAGFEIREDKVQHSSPWTYLGLQIHERTIVPQQLAIKEDPKTLRDLHSLCGSINWIRPLLGVTTEDLTPLFNLLRGSGDLHSPRALTPEARDTITKVQEALSSHQAHHIEPSLPLQFAVLVLGKMPYLHGLVFQWDKVQRDPLLIIEWVFLSHQLSKSITMPQELMAQLVIKARSRLCTLAGCDFTCVYLPLTTNALDHLLQNNNHLQFAFDSYSVQISAHNPKHKLFNSAFKLIPKEIQSRKPLNALTVFTDGS